MPASLVPTPLDGPQTPRLDLSGVSKTFGRVKVLTDVSLAIGPGEIHGLVGQNGSGKSTLIKILSGVYSPDAGSRIAIDGTELRLPVAPQQLREVGAAFVHQNLGLDLEANVIENVRVGRFQIHPITRRIRWKAEAESVATSLAGLGADSVNPYALVGSLSHAERASVAIARAIQGIEKGTGLIVFDESTQSLPRDILHEFYAKVRALAVSGTSVLIVSHRLDEVLALCDRVTVLEDGHATVLGQPTAGLSEADLTRLILGKSIANRGARQLVKGASRARAEVALSARGVSGRFLKNTSFDIHAGEVVGVIGTGESGFDELPYLLSGARPATAGTVVIGGVERPLARLTPADTIRMGLCLVPGDRTGSGLATELLALENLTLPRLTIKGTRFSLRQRWQLDEFLSAVTSLGVTPAAPSLPMGSYSGGNQQKVLLAKWLLNDPKALVLHEPTQAVDVGARADILQAIRTQAERGVGVLIASLESEDLASVCDRILVLKDGAVVRELIGNDVSPHTIIDAVYAGISTEIAHVAV